MSSNKPSLPPRSCLCAPTTHPGSFRCSRHRSGRRPAGGRSSTAGSGPKTRVESMGWSSAKARSMRGVLMQMIKPSSPVSSRRRNFQPKPSRFWVLNGSGQGVAVA